VLKHGRPYLPKAEINAILTRERKRRRRLVDTMLDKFFSNEETPKISIIKGEPKTVIPKLAKKLKANVVIMGTVGRTGVPRMIVGNNADLVMSQLNCSILAIKPEQFVSPVIL